MMIAMHIIFQGRVQGVGFRYTSLRIAAGYALTGSVRNLPDGSVEMLAQGMKKDIDNCLSDIQEYFGGHIRDCATKEIPFDPRHADFRISY
jgi:acylphosphatase